MIEITLIAIPNQSFSIQLDNSVYNFKIRFLINFMAVDLVRDNITILNGIRIVPGFPIIPFRYLEQGNFILLTANHEYPLYTQFGINQFLFYVSQDELEAIRAAAA
jgi:hypothetical protein